MESTSKSSYENGQKNNAEARKTSNSENSQNELLQIQSFSWIDKKMNSNVLCFFRKDRGDKNIIDIGILKKRGGREDFLEHSVTLVINNSRFSLQNKMHLFLKNRFIQSKMSVKGKIPLEKIKVITYLSKIHKSRLWFE